MSDEIHTPTEDAPEISRKKRGGFKVFLWQFGIALALIAGIYWVALPALAPKPAPTSLVPDANNSLAPIVKWPQLDALTQRLESAESRIATLEEKLESTQSQLATMAIPTPTTSDAPQESLSADSATKLGDLERNVYLLQKRVENITPLHHLALLNAFADIQKAVRRNESFSSQLSQITQIAQDRPATLKLLSSLQPFAAQPVATLDILKQNFSSAALRALTKESDINSLARNLRSLIHIRKEGMPQGNDDESIIARAESKLKDANVSGAIEELKTLSPEASLVFAPWTRAAEAYAKLHAALAALERDLAVVDAPKPAAAPVAQP